MNQIFSWAKSHGRTRMLIYYRSVSATSIFNLQFYPAAQDVLRSRLQDHKVMPIPPEYRGRNN